MHELIYRYDGNKDGMREDKIIRRYNKWCCLKLDLVRFLFVLLSPAVKISFAYYFLLFTLYYNAYSRKRITMYFSIYNESFLSSQISLYI